MITTRDSIELAAAELEDIFECSFDEILVTDRNGVVVRINSECEKNYRLSVNEIVGMHVEDLQKKGVFYPSATLQVIESEKPIELIQKTNYGRYLHVRTRPVFDTAGTLVRVISYSRDITELTELKKKIEEMEGQLQSYKQIIEEPFELNGIVSRSSSMRTILDLIQKVSKVNSTILILGETGVGKSRMVKMIHQLSDRKDHVLNEINCAALPEHLIESELFGYESGAFTGASREGKKGLIELSDKGILFLDEVGELPYHLQGKLLQVIQEKKFRPVGGKSVISADIRIIAATNQNLEKMVAVGKFRKDLFYRLNVIPVHIPPLRERKEDILPLVYHFLEHYNQQYDRDVKLSPKVLEWFVENNWDGNIREVENMVERLVVTNEWVVTTKELPAEMRPSLHYIPGKTLKEILWDVEGSVIRELYEKHKSSYKVAKELGVSQSAAMRKINRYVKEEMSYKHGEKYS